MRVAAPFQLVIVPSGRSPMIASSEDSTIEARLRDASSTCFGAVQGIAGFGDTVSDALRDLAYLFAEHQYELRGNSVRIEVAGTFIQVTAIAGQSPSDVLMALAGVIEGRGYQESAFPEPNWRWLANEERTVPSKHQKK